MNLHGDWDELADVVLRHAERLEKYAEDDGTRYGTVFSIQNEFRFEANHLRNVVEQTRPDRDLAEAS